MNDTITKHLALLAGGYGTRLWPWSRMSIPKQFKSFPHGRNDESLYQRTLRRNRPLHFASSSVMCLQQHREECLLQSKQTDMADIQLILEPEGRGTTASIAACALKLHALDDDSVMVVSPVDQIFAFEDQYAAALEKAIAYAYEHRNIVLLGINPTSPSSSYGYIVTDTLDGLNETTPAKVNAFIEKPSEQQASTLIEAGNAFWNAGIFIAPTSVILQEIQAKAPVTFAAVKQSVANGKQNKNSFSLHVDSWDQTIDLPFDKAVCEKSDNLRVFSVNGWQDVGNFLSVKQYLDTLDSVPGLSKSNGNTMLGNVTAMNSTNNLMVSSRHRHLAAIDIENLMVIDDGDVVVVAPLASAEKLGTLARQVGMEKKELFTDHPIAKRPWGHFESLVTTGNFRVKRLIINPGHAISMQKHQHRTEHWTVITGIATVILDDQTNTLSPNDSIKINAGSIHSLRNNGTENLEILEVQTGSYFGEDDIVRLKDDYGRET